ncbi:hypothetical protein AVEN_5121-1, partial [Araneus ventricosus]
MIPEKSELHDGIRYLTIPEILKTIDRSIQTINGTGTAS